MIISGDPVDASTALTLGLVDGVTDGAVVEAAIACRGLVIKGQSHEEMRDLDHHVASDRADTAWLTDVRGQIDRTHRGQFAPEQIVKCVEAAVMSDDFDVGMSVEKRALPSV